jgi:hypothetical protein
MAITTTISPEGAAGIVCHAWVGFILGRQHVADVYHRLGQEGAGVQSLGMRAKPTSCKAIVLCADYATALNTMGTLNRLRAQFVIVVDGFSESLRCLCHDADARIFAGKHGYAGTLYTHRVEADLVLEYVGDSPSIGVT